MQVKVYLANLKLNRIYHFEKQKIIANDYLTQTYKSERLTNTKKYIMMRKNKRDSSGQGVIPYRRYSPRAVMADLV